MLLRDPHKGGDKGTHTQRGGGGQGDADDTPGMHGGLHAAHAEQLTTAAWLDPDPKPNLETKCIQTAGLCAP